MFSLGESQRKFARKWGLPTVWSLSISSPSTTSLVHAATDSTATWFRRVLCKIGQWSIGAGVEMCQKDVISTLSTMETICRQNICNHFIIGKSRGFPSVWSPQPLNLSPLRWPTVKINGSKNLAYEIWDLPCPLPSDAQRGNSAFRMLPKREDVKVFVGWGIYWLET